MVYTGTIDMFVNKNMSRGHQNRLILETPMGIHRKTFSEDRDLKEQIGCRVEPEVKKILEEIASKEFRTLSNLDEKLICERFRELGYLDEQFKPKTNKRKVNKQR